MPSTSSKASEIDEVAWTDRLLSIMKYLDDTAVKALLTISGLKNRQALLSFLTIFGLITVALKPTVFV